uniref:PHD-type domain-containing protein n=1 Tax=Glossina austeni TaxID=7395 RepID=A0A1A9UYB2_GLOAU
MASSMLSAEAGNKMPAITTNDDALASNSRICANDPDFAMICAFLQKFYKDLCLDLPNFSQLQEWLTRTDEVSCQLRDLHIKLLRKTRKTVHEKSWESALSKFCFTYSAQDAWEIERFGYKNSSIKVKLRILRELLESQFERNAKFRAKILSFSADSLRLQPIGRDRLGHAYWVTQDGDCNIRIYQEHLDEEIWHLVATNRMEFANLITRLKANEVVLPSANIGVVDEDTNSNSSIVVNKRSNTSDEQDDSQECDRKIPNLRIKLNTKKKEKQETDGENAIMRDEKQSAEEDCKFHVENGEISDVDKCMGNGHKKPNKPVEDTSNETELSSCNIKVKSLGVLQTKRKLDLSERLACSSIDKKSTSGCVDTSRLVKENNQNNTLKKSWSSVVDFKSEKKRNNYDDEHIKEVLEDSSNCEEEEVDEEDMDSAAAEEDENEEKEIEPFDDNDENILSEEIEDPIIQIQGSGSGKECDVGNVWLAAILPRMESEDNYLSFVGEAIEEEFFYVYVEGSGIDCLVGNEKGNEDSASSNTPLFAKESSPSSNTLTTGTLSNLDATISLKENSLESPTHIAQKSIEMKPQVAEIHSDQHSSAKINSDLTAAESNNAEENKNCGVTAPLSTETIEDDFVKDPKQPQEKCENSENISTNETKVNELVEEKETAESGLNEKNPDSISEEHTKYIEGKVNVEQDQLKSSHPNVKPSSPTETISETEVIETKKFALESLKKELRECKQKSLENNIQSLKEINIPNASKPVAWSRKRRFNEFTSLQNSRPSNSESEIEINSENLEDLAQESQAGEEPVVGGKRLKMRLKQTNPEIRKKIEAQKDAANEETTSSSSGEEDSRNRRKIISPKKHFQKNEDASLSTSVSRSPGHGDTEGLKKVEDEIICNTATNAVPKAAQIITKCRPSLAEIIEKKLKRSCRRADVSVTTDVTKIENVSPSSNNMPPSKDCPILQPLKKNLLTQLRQKEKESDDEAIPRKRTTSASSSTKTAVENITDVTETDCKEDNFALSIQEETSEKQKKLNNSANALQEEFHEEDVSKEELSNNAEPKCINLKADLEELSEEVKKENVNEVKKKEASDVKKGVPFDSQTSASSRRSGRRGGTNIIYAELPQPKRTRNGSKNVNKTPSKILKGDLSSKQMKPSAETNEINKEVKDKKGESSNLVKCLLSTKGEDAAKQKKDQSDSVVLKLSNKTPTISADKTPAISANKSLTISANKTSKNSNNKMATTSTNKAALVVVTRGKGSRKKREVDTTNIIESTDAETPVRQSRRIAQQKIREEAERRKLEEIALRTMKQELKKKKKAEKQSDPTVIEPSEPSSDSEQSSVETKKKRPKKKLPGKNGSWSSDSEEQEEPDEEDDEDPPHYETDPGSPLFKSDHEFSPESDLEDETQIVPMKRARTARKEDASGGEEKDEEEACQQCGKSDHPEWILLCDKCDKGYHCSCLSPVLFYIPEGDWYCPPCQQDQLIEALEKHLKEFDNFVDQKRKEDEEEKRLANEESKYSEKSSDANEEICKNKFLSSKIFNDIKSSRVRKQATARADRHRRRTKRSSSESESESKSRSPTDTNSKSNSSSSTYSDSDNEPIYKLRKRRQINVSYRLNEYDDLINSALKKEMDEAAGAGNLGRGKDITTIIEADKEEKARQRLLENQVSSKGMLTEGEHLNLNDGESVSKTGEVNNTCQSNEKDSEDEPTKRKANLKQTLKKKSRKLTTLDVSSEDDGSDEDFKTSSFDDEEEEEDTTNSTSTDSDSILEIYRRRGNGKKKQRRAARRSMRERRKDRKFIIDESDDEDEDARPSTLKKKRRDDSDYTETEVDDDYLSELSENIDSAELCDDTTSEDSDGAWRPNKRKKQRKMNHTARKSPKLKKPLVKKQKKIEYSDDDVTESEEEEEEEEEIEEGKGSGKQPRSQIPKTIDTTPKSNTKVKGKITVSKIKKKSKASDEDLSFSDSGDSTRRTRGRRYAYIEDFDDESSDGGIKPGVQRPDTPPEEREKFIKRQEEIKRMLAEKNAEGAKLAATPRLTPIKTHSEKDKRSPSKISDSLSTVPISVIRQAKALDIDYLQRKGEHLDDLENDVDDVDDFDDADLPDDLPDDMDEDAIARMVEEEEEFNASASRDLPAPDEVLKTPSGNKPKTKDMEKPSGTSTSIIPVSTAGTVLPSGLQEPVRKRLPMPTIYPPLLRHQFPLHCTSIPTSQIIQRSHAGPPSHLLQSALSAPLSQPLQRNYTSQPPTSHLHTLADRLSHTTPIASLTSQVLGSRTSTPNVPGKLTSMSAIASTQTKSATLSNQPESVTINEPKPRGRRKKITPLRDPLQKQQIAAAVTAANSASGSSDKLGPTCELSTALTAIPSSVIKSGPPAPNPIQPSVITSLSHFSHSIATNRSVGSPYSTPEAFYAARSTLGVGRHRGAPPNLLPPHPSVRPTYGPPPPLRGSATGLTHSTSSGASNIRARFATPSSLTARDHQLSTFIGSSPRPPAPNLNPPYRQQIYGNPNYGPRVHSPASNLKRALPPSHGAEYSTTSRVFPPYVYYPPPPPLTTPIQSQPQTSASTQMKQTPIPISSSTSVIVAAPPSASLSPTAIGTSDSSAITPKVTTSKSRSPTDNPGENKSLTESPKKLTTLESYKNSSIKSPLPVDDESSGSRSPIMHQDPTECSSSPQTVSDSANTAQQHSEDGEGKASEFSGLVSYFSSQHSDYNT